MFKSKFEHKLVKQLKSNLNGYNNEIAELKYIKQVEKESKILYK